jgi:hypothetical protein
MAKHFDLTIGEASFSFRRKHDAIAAAAALDGVYVVRGNAAAADLDDAATVGANKSLAQVERAFRRLKTIDLHARPIHHWNADRVRAHVFLRMLGLYVEHRMYDKLARMLYDETDHETASAARVSSVAMVERSQAAKAKEATRRTAFPCIACAPCSPISPPIPVSRRQPP